MSDSMKFHDDFVFEPKTLDDFIFLFGIENGAFEYFMSLTPKAGTSADVSRVDLKTNTVWLCPTN